MDIRKIIKEEIDDFGWTENVPKGLIPEKGMTFTMSEPEHTGHHNVNCVITNIDSMVIGYRAVAEDGWGFRSMMGKGVWKRKVVGGDIVVVDSLNESDFGWADTPNYIPIEDFVSCVVCDGDYVRVTKRAGVDIFGLKYVPDNSGDNVLEDGEYEIYRNNLGHTNSQWIELVGPKDGNIQQYSFFVDISEMDNFWFEQIPSPYEDEE